MGSLPACQRKKERTKERMKERNLSGVYVAGGMREVGERDRSWLSGVPRQCIAMTGAVTENAEFAAFKLVRTRVPTDAGKPKKVAAMKCKSFALM